jgi:UDP-N-acetylmuramoyl-tripeptide--D-alanyl-D-alanine ligase
MGIVRSIREKLGLHQYAVIEMAAYGKGSIRKLCQLTPPNSGIITGVGLAHLDRFGSEENIFEAKSELAEAVSDLLVCNGDNIGSRRMAQKFNGILYGFNADCDLFISDWVVSEKGTNYTFQWKGKSYPGITPLLGKTALSNIAGAFAMACSLGANPELVIGAIANLKPVENRLQLEKANGRIYLHDAYNSNPIGFEEALTVLQKLPAKKKILMTPGMIELSTKSDELHEMIGKKAAAICDHVLIVGKQNKASLTKGVGKEKSIFVKNRKEAFEKLGTLLEEGDAVLIENDLPDLYETKELF